MKGEKLKLIKNQALFYIVLSNLVDLYFDNLKIYTINGSKSFSFFFYKILIFASFYQKFSSGKKLNTDTQDLYTTRRYLNYTGFELKFDLSPFLKRKRKENLS